MKSGFLSSAFKTSKIEEKKKRQNTGERGKKKENLKDHTDTGIKYHGCKNDLNNFW